MDNPAPITDARLADDRPFRRLGFLIVLGVFGGLGLWAAAAPLASAALAPGIVTVENYRKTVQHLEGGIVKAIHVHDGDVVTPGQVLVTLDDTSSRAQLEVARGQYFAALAREARLQAQRDGLERVRYPEPLLENRGDARVREAIRVQDQAFRARKLAMDGEISLHERQVGQLQAKRRGLLAQGDSQRRLADSFQGELKDFEALLQEGYAEKQKVRELERSLSQSQGRYGQLLADAAAADLQISETRLRIVQLRKDLQREVVKELSEVQEELFGLRERLQSLQSTVARTQVVAPDGGSVLGLAVHTLGAVIPPGGRLLDIVPRNGKLLVEAQVSPRDIDRVRVGQRSEVRFTAFKMRDTPRIEGRLVSISADSLTNDKDKAPYYLARVEVTPAGLEQLARHRLELVPGMPSEVLINTGSRTALQYLVAPMANMLARAFTED